MAKNKGVKIELPVSTEENAEPTAADVKSAMKGSLEAVRECKRLIQEGQFPGSYANKVIGCLAYLEAIEGQIKEQLDK